MAVATARAAAGLESALAFSEHIIARPRLVIVVAVLLAATGFAAVATLPKEREPRIRLPVVIVTVPHPGSDPAQNEAEIVRRIEREAAQLSGLRDRGRIHAIAARDVAVVQFEFRHGVDIETAKRDVESLVNRIRGQLPPAARDNPGPQVRDIAMEDFPIIQVFVAGGADGRARRQVAERLRTLIEPIEGVRDVALFGGEKREVQIEVNPHVMAHYGLSYETVAAAIEQANTPAPTGRLEPDGGFDFGVQVGGRLTSLEQMRQIAFPAGGDRVVHLGDFAEVYEGVEPPESIARYGGADAVVLAVQPQRDLDVLRTTGAVQRVVDRFIESGEAGEMSIGTVRSQSREIHFMLSELGGSVMYGVVLVLIVLCVFTGWRNALLIGLVMPFALLAAAALMSLARVTGLSPDLSLNKMTLLGAILVVGMVVDGCIIVGENIYRHRQLGLAPLRAAQRGIGEVGPSLATAYLTTFAAFVPMFFIRGVFGDFIELLPIVVLFSLVGAMLVDHYLLPALTVYFMKAKAVEPGGAAAPGGRGSAGGAGGEGDGVAEADRYIAASRAARAYGRFMRAVIPHRLLVLGMVLALAAAPLALYGSGAIGVEFLPEGDVPIVEVHFDLPLGSSMQRRTVPAAERIEQAVERAVLENEWYRPSPVAPRVRPVTTIGEAGALSIKLDTEHGSGPEFGLVYVELASAEHRRRSAAQIRQAIAREIEAARREHPELTGVRYRIRTPAEGPPAGAPVMLRVLARDEVSMQTLVQRAAGIEQQLEQVPGVYDVTSDFQQRTELRADPHPAIAGRFDVTRGQISRAVSFALQGVRVGEVDFGGNETIDLRLRNAPAFRAGEGELESLPLISPSGAYVALSDVALFSRDERPNAIRRYDSQRVVHIRAQLRDGVLVDDVRAALAARLNEASGAAGATAGRRDAAAAAAGRYLLADDQVRVEFGGEMELRDEAMGDLGLAMLAALAGMMMILTVRFNSFIQPLIVLASVPLSLIGVFIGLLVFDLNFSVAAMIGVLALAGVVVNDSIVLVDFVNRMRRLGVPLERAVVYAGQLRLRPIFATTLTTICGLLPLALNLTGGGEFWQPLTVAVIFGLAFATVLELLVIPLACLTLDRRAGATILDPADHAHYGGGRLAAAVPG